MFFKSSNDYNFNKKFKVNHIYMRTQLCILSKPEIFLILSKQLRTQDCLFYAEKINHRNIFQNRRECSNKLNIYEFVFPKNSSKFLISLPKFNRLPIAVVYCMVLSFAVFFLLFISWFVFFKICNAFVSD